jgi:hypothetical protein
VSRPGVAIESVPNMALLVDAVDPRPSGGSQGVDKFEVGPDRSPTGMASVGPK